MKIKVNINEIDWCVEEKDVPESITNKSAWIKWTKGSLPRSVSMMITQPRGVDFKLDEGMLDEAISEKLLNKYGWWVNSYTYEIV